MIFEALCVLIIDKKREITTISVKDIAEEAGVCRNSFYRNFGSIDEILLKKMDAVWGTTVIDEGIRLPALLLGMLCLSSLYTTGTPILQCSSHLT